MSFNPSLASEFATPWKNHAGAHACDPMILQLRIWGTRPQLPGLTHIHVCMDAILIHIHGVSEKTVQDCFCQNFVKFPSLLIIVGRWMAKWLKFYAISTFSTSPHLTHVIALPC